MQQVGKNWTQAQNTQQLLHTPGDIREENLLVVHCTLAVKIKIEAKTTWYISKAFIKHCLYQCAALQYLLWWQKDNKLPWKAGLEHFMEDSGLSLWKQ